VSSSIPTRISRSGVTCRPCARGWRRPPGRARSDATLSRYRLPPWRGGFSPCAYLAGIWLYVHVRDPGSAAMCTVMIPIPSCLVATSGLVVVIESWIDRRACVLCGEQQVPSGPLSLSGGRRPVGLI